MNLPIMIRPGEAVKLYRKIVILREIISNDSDGQLLHIDLLQVRFGFVFSDQKFPKFLLTIVSATPTGSPPDYSTTPEHYKNGTPRSRLRSLPTSFPNANFGNRTRLAKNFRNGFGNDRIAGRKESHFGGICGT